VYYFIYSTVLIKPALFSSFHKIVYLNLPII